MPKRGIEVVIEAGRLDLDKKHLRAVMRSAGAEVAAVARALVRRSAGGGRLYWRAGRRYRASAPGQPPVSVSGTLARSIKVRPFKSGEGVAIRDAAFYAIMLEAGAQGGGPGNKRIGAHHKGKYERRGVRVVAPRPFLSRALDDRRASIAQRIAEAIEQGTKFQRLKP